MKFIIYVQKLLIIFKQWYIFIQNKVVMKKMPDTSTNLHTYNNNFLKEIGNLSISWTNSSSLIMSFISYLSEKRSHNCIK